MMMPNFANLSALRGSFNNFSPMHALMGQPNSMMPSWGGSPQMGGTYGFQPHNPMPYEPVENPGMPPVHNPMQSAPNFENPGMPARNPMQPAPMPINNPVQHAMNPYMQMTALMPQGTMRRSPGRQF